MRFWSAVGLGLLFCCSGASGPRISDHRFEVTPAGPPLAPRTGPREPLQGLRTTIRQFADSHRLPQLPSGGRELRLWRIWSFTAGPEYMWLSLDSRGWTVRYFPTDSTYSGFSWSGQLPSSLAVALESLERVPQDSITDVVVSDGGSYYLEWVLDGKAGDAGADNPESHCSTYDRRLLDIISVLWHEAQPCSGAP
jgi:hypothetical protein